MSRAARFSFALVIGLALLTWGASLIVNRTTRDWFERDVALRARLAVSGSRLALVVPWRRGEAETVKQVLVELTRDERIMSAAACSADGKLLVATAEFPGEFSCTELGAALAGRPSGVSDVRTLRGGLVHVSAIPVLETAESPGFVVLVHDLAWMQRREEKTTRFLLIAFGVMAFAAAIVTLVASRLSWRDWNAELRRLIRGGKERPEFQPILRDVRELMDQITFERDAGGEGGEWNPAKLRQTLSKHLPGERVVIVANREPYIHERTQAGGVEVLHPASGLVTALEPVMRACSGVWVAHGSGSADRETSDGHGRVQVPPGQEAYTLRRVWLSKEEERGYYYGFANEGMWPLCHIADTRPTFRAEDYRAYVEVNRRFADAACEEAGGEDPLILVQDYHFALAPRMIRERLPRATILTFWHIPWPNSERFGICPWRNELLEGLLGSSIIGFHTQFHCNNFLDAVDRFMEARIDREQNAVVYRGETSLVRPYPISIEWPSRWGEGLPPAEECRRQVFEQLGLAKDALLGVGVDRLDYTKGIEERLLAVERMLEQHPELRSRFTFVQLAAPSRTVIERYRQLNESVEALAARINAKFAAEGSAWKPVVILRAHHEPPTVFRFYRAADVVYVSSLHDGMNLVAKEFIAARDDERGVLVLSHFTGAARELTEALIVNPYDLDEASRALHAALTMSADEQRSRMRYLRAFVSEFNVYRWAGRMLVDAARLRRRGRLAGRLTEETARRATAS